MDVQNLPYTSEYAKSGRAGCKLCKNKIDKDELRLGAMVQSAFHDGKQAQWYHQNCFFQKLRPTTEGDIAHFEGLRYEDQQQIREKIAALVSGVVAPPTGKGKGKKRTAEQSMALKDFGVEYAASGRALCRGCEIKILKDEIRIKKIDYTTEVGMKYGGQPLWHHAECFAKLRSELGYFDKGESLPGFTGLKKEDKETVKKLLPAIKQEEIPEKKMKCEPKDEADSAQEIIDEKLYAEQQKAFFKIRDKIKDLDVKKNDLISILNRNKQAVPEGYDACLERVCDILTFGTLQPCPKCKGQYVLQKSAYMCEGNLTEWVKCLNSDKKPPRVPTKIPSDIKKAYSFLGKYKSVVSERVIKYVPPSLSTTMKKVKKEEQLEPKIKREKPALYNLQFVILGKTATSKDLLKEKIQKLGGKVSTKITSTIAAIISTQDEVERMGSRMQEAKEMQIQVVPEDFLEDAANGGALSFITSKSICDWGSDPHSRIPQDEEKSKSKKSIYTKSMPSKMTLKLKGGLAVDPDSGLDDVAHVYKTDKEIYNCVMNKVDIQTDKNSFFKMQVLKADKGGKYWFFRAWGRIGTTIGGNKLEKCSTAIDAINSFKYHFEEKSGNPWESQLEGTFCKRPGLYYPVDIDYGDEKTKKLAENTSNIKSKLEPAVQDLVRMLFDVDTMKKVMLEFELDMEKMPLGKLSQKQLLAAMKVLTELSDLIVNGGSNPLFIDASNRFYSLIPHNFGVETPTVLDTVEQVKEKQAMLDSLMEIEIAYSLLNAETDENMNPLDAHYEQLKTEMETLKRESEEFKMLEKYVKNTHAETHTAYELEIEEIFKIKRKGEDRRYKPFRKLHNRKLLWHGSRTTNFVGILSHGLKIAPPEAPVTGYMFGKGIYFADMVSKSANYCCTSPSNSTGLMLLCEVALGDMVEYQQAHYVTKLPADKHSTKGVGRTCPDPNEVFVRPDGVEIPLGKGIVSDPKLKSSLLYNEYIVYDVAQVNCQYMFRMNFKYKY
ncbi:poly [ADP-ribose] polymerase [Toxorhynchites rutilus septentrionalis]|uniref:poly [ADP-ribose] polymerase n=1 Tax=Toxorhynchites rutilus septentrionalis TaxID=329112 RepID=UPI0024784AC1|nr:poly [ADP-ribose] polymerase [Toxorhynchites rutilus septentrionalis]